MKTDNTKHEQIFNLFIIQTALDLNSTLTLEHCSTHCLAQITCSLKVVGSVSRISSKLKHEKRITQNDGFVNY